jgi:hypothetical protein
VSRRPQPIEEPQQRRVPQPEIGRARSIREPAGAATSAPREARARRAVFQSPLKLRNVHLDRHSAQAGTARATGLPIRSRVSAKCWPSFRMAVPQCQNSGIAEGLFGKRASAGEVKAGTVVRRNNRTERHATIRDGTMATAMRKPKTRGFGTCLFSGRRRMIIVA